MLIKKLLPQVAASCLAGGIALAAIADIAFAATALRNGQPVSGFIQGSSASFTYRNTAKKGSPTEKAVGEDYTFAAKQGDSIIISVEREEGSNLAPIIVLISARNNSQVAFNNTSSLLRYTIPATGDYKLLVLGKNSSRGRYKLSVSGISDAAATAAATDTSRRQMLQREYGLTAMDSCPAATNSLVVANFVDGNQITKYCANPTRLVKAGEYTYDTASNDLKPGAPAVAATASTDPRRQTLQKEYGLTVLDSCPPATGSLVVVNFTEAGQNYRYCANPTRLVKAGEYAYDTASGELKPATAASTPASTPTKPADAPCLVNIPGTNICLVR